ncbi:DUF1697 domain-containing protein [Enterococcus sp. LJL128]
MERYIALLRGINVGGKNKISMPLLKAAFEKIGFLDVVTYINSGNIVFSSDIQDKSDLIRKCEATIVDEFALNIPVTVVSAKDLATTLSNAPEWWNIEKESIHYAIFVISPVTVEEVFAEVGEVKPEYEQISHHGNVIFWSAPRKTFNKARWSKIASSSVNNSVTIRNANTVNKLLQLTSK